MLLLPRCNVSADFFMGIHKNLSMSLGHLTNDIINVVWAGGSRWRQLLGVVGVNFWDGRR